MRAKRVFPRDTILLIGALAVSIGLGFWAVGSALAAAGPVLTSVYSDSLPTVDGIIKGGSPLTITLRSRSIQPNTRVADLYLLNSATDLYIGIVFPEPVTSREDLFGLYFDSDHDHNATSGAEDAITYNILESSGGGLWDGHWASGTWASDTIEHGTVARTYTNGRYTYEFRKPLNSGDQQDMAVSPGATLGFFIRFTDGDTGENFVYPEYTWDGQGGNPAVDWLKWPELRLTKPPSVTTAPILLAPENGVRLLGMGPTLSWSNPSGAIQAYVQVNPANNDGPGTNLILSRASSLRVPPPPGWYGLLPDMTYTWRVRATSKLTFAPEDDESWGPWSEWWIFRTPAPSSVTISPLSPADAATVTSTARQSLRWKNTATDIFYYEVQVSVDPSFNTDPATATSFVWSNLVHGGVSVPLNSYLTPELPPNATIYWRVRPRVQGDGTPVEWSATWSFKTP